ncbi:MAG: thiamine pyrophosphate-dependent enzyme [Pseudomonadota bacterium]
MTQHEDVSPTRTQTGARLLVASLEALGAEIAFGVPGESYLAVLDALHDSRIRFVLCRQEGGAAFMAAAAGKLTGRPGICFVTRGPGATNASIGVHTARQDASPMLLFVGQVARGMMGREAFQEVDYTKFFAPLAKGAFEIDDPARVPEFVGRAHALALSGRPGPVVISLPEDMLTEAAAAVPLTRALPTPRPAADADDVARVAAALHGAARPLVLIGGGGWDDPTAPVAGRPALAALMKAAEDAGIAVATGFRRQDLVDNNSPAYVGDAGVGMAPQVRRAIREADVLVALNLRFGETETDGYTLLDVPEPTQRLFHVHPEASELGKIYRPEMAIQACAARFADGLSRALPALGPRAGLGAVSWAAALREGIAAQLAPPAQPAGLDMAEVMRVLRERLPADAVLCNGAGNFAIWPTRLFLFGPCHRLLAPQSGAMGHGLPAAVAAKIMEPERTVICFAGDGDIQMTMQELGTAMQAGAQPVVFVINNGSYGTIRMHQERHYPARVSGTEIVNPDYPAIGRAYGMHGERVAETAAFEPALERALSSPTGALLELIQPTEALTPRETLSQMREKALAAAGASS